MKLDEISTLLAAASARPWRVMQRKPHGGTIYDSGTAIDQVASIHCGGECGTGPANLDLIVELVNAAPQLLAIARAAQAWRDATSESTPYDNTYQRKEARTRADLALRVALQEAG